MKILKGASGVRLYDAISNDQVYSFSVRRYLDKDLKLGKHATATVSSDEKILLAWDDTGAEASSSWGKLDLGSGLMERLGSQAGVLFPVIAETQPIAVPPVPCFFISLLNCE